MVDVAVQLMNSPPCRNSFRCFAGRIGFIKQPLTLEIGKVNIVTINQPQCANSGSRERFSVKTTKSAAANDRNHCSAQFLLTRRANRSNKICLEYRSSPTRRFDASASAKHGALSPAPYRKMLASFRGIICVCASVALVLSATEDKFGGDDLLQRAKQYDGQKIASIEFDPTQQPFAATELLRLLPFQAGDIFRPRLLRLAIQNLFSTGRFTSVAIDARAQNAGVALRFITESAYFVGHVSIFGLKSPPNEGQLSGAAKLSLGTRYQDSDRFRAAGAMLDMLRENGFYQARIDSAVTYQPDTQEAISLLMFKLATVLALNLPRLPAIPRLRTPVLSERHAGSAYTGFSVGMSLLLHGSSRDSGMSGDFTNSATCFAPKLALLHFSTCTRPIPYVLIRIEAGPKILVRIAGVRMSSSRLRQLIPVFQERSVDTDLLIEGQRNLQHYLQSIGYFGAAVTYTVTGGNGSNSQTITYAVTRGRGHRLVAVLIRGNHFFATSAVRERLFTTAAEFPRFPRGRFSEENLRTDVQAVEALYVSNGFRSVKVTSRTIDDYLGVRDQIAVEISILEGRQTLVSNLSITGISTAEISLIRGMLSSSAGQPFSDVNVAFDRDNILRFYYDLGYLEADFQFYVAPGADASHVNLSYVVKQGGRAYVRDIIVSGLETTKRRLVLDRITLRRDQPLSLADQTESQRRLYDLGIFARVNSSLQNPDGGEPSKYVLYDMDEARHYALTVGFGAQIARIGGGVTSLDNPAGTTGFAPRVALGITRENFLGLGQTVGVQTAVSTIRQRVAITYFIPQFVSHENLNLTTTALLDKSNDVRTFSADRREASIQLGERLSRAYSIQYRFVFREVSQSNLKINPLLVPLLSQPETVGLTEVSFIQDKRDDPTDAHHGVYSTLDLGYAPGSLGSQTHFARGLVRNSSYYQISRDLVLARSTQFGVIARTGGRRSVPLAERLYSGGSTSIRAFPDFQAGPRDLVTGFPLGGNALFINNTELRFPVFGENLGGVLFHDAGNVYSSVQELSFRFRQRSQQDFNYLVQNFGLGVRYRTPIGPLRVDLSVSPDAPRFFGLKGTLQDYLNGRAVATSQKINAFQFHISLGQAF